MNAKDQVTRLSGLHSKDKSISLVNEIKVEINQENGEISIMNNGDGIDVAEHPKEKKNGKPIYIPQLIFGELLTSTNYNKEEQKIVGCWQHNNDSATLHSSTSSLCLVKLNPNWHEAGHFYPLVILGLYYIM